MIRAGERMAEDMTKSELHKLIEYLKELGFEDAEIIKALLFITE